MLDGKVILEVAHGPKDKRFIVWAFDEELKLRMLIGDAKRCGRRLPIINFAPSSIDLLSKAFTSQLLEPERKLPERLRVREQHQNLFLLFTFKHELDERRRKRRILKETAASANR